MNQTHYLLISNLKSNFFTYNEKHYCLMDQDFQVDSVSFSSGQDFLGNKLI